MYVLTLNGLLFIEIIVQITAQDNGNDLLELFLCFRALLQVTQNGELIEYINTENPLSVR